MQSSTLNKTGRPVYNRVLPVSIARRKRQTIDKIQHTFYIYCYFEQNPRTKNYEMVYKTISRQRLIEAIQNKEVVLVNGKLSKDGRLLFTVPETLEKAVPMVAESIRNYLELRYGKDLTGRCVEASNLITSHLSLYGFVRTREVSGWCLYDDPIGCSTRPYDEHTWVEAESTKLPKRLYIDITADQFNRYVDDKYSKINITKKLLHNMSYTEPQESE